MASCCNFAFLNTYLKYSISLFFYNLLNIAIQMILLINLLIWFIQYDVFFYTVFNIISFTKLLYLIYFQMDKTSFDLIPLFLDIIPYVFTFIFFPVHDMWLFMNTSEFKGFRFSVSYFFKGFIIHS